MKIHKIGAWEYWYDRSYRCWYAILRDDFGHQVGIAIDAHTKENIVRYIKYNDENDTGTILLNDTDYVANHKFNHAQLTALCKLAVRDNSHIIDVLISHHRLSESHIDILIDSKFTSDRYSVFDNHRQMLSPRQIGLGLNDEYQFIRHAASEHPCCTDAQRVAYRLKWGNDD